MTKDFCNMHVHMYSYLMNKFVLAVNTRGSESKSYVEISKRSLLWRKR